MYLTARLFGVFTYVLTLAAALAGIWVGEPKHLKRNLLGYLLVLTLMGFFFVPPPSFDLYRLLGYMRAYDGLGWGQLFQEMAASATPALPLYYYLISKLGHPGFLAAVTVVITFSCCFSVLWRGVLRFQGTKYGVALALLFLMASGFYTETINGIRTMLAFSIIGFCFYLEVLEGKRFLRHIPAYLFAALIHRAGIVLVAIRIFYMLLQRSRDLRGKLRSLLIVLGCGLAGVLLFRNQLAAAMEAAMAYILKDKYSYGWNILSGFFKAAVILYTCANVRRIVTNEGGEDAQSVRDYLRFTCWMVALSLGFLPLDYAIFNRFLYFAVLLSLPMLLLLYNERNQEHYKLSTIYKDTLLLVGILLVLMCTRGEICSIKFWE